MCGNNGMMTLATSMAPGDGFAAGAWAAAGFTMAIATKAIIAAKACRSERRAIIGAFPFNA